MAQPSPMEKGWCPVDNSFGPAVTDCRGDFDFTLLFEESILSILPSAIFLLIVPNRLLHVYRGSKKVRRSTLQIVKLINSVLYFALQIELLVRWAKPGVLRTPLSVASGTLAVLDAAAIAVLSFFHHSRSVRPSTILQLYLSISLLFDIARTRTLWLLKDDAVLASVFAAATASKALMLCLEIVEKRTVLEPAFRSLMREATSGFANLSIFWWLNEPLRNGARQILSLKDLDELSEDFRSDILQSSLETTWAQASKSNRHSLLIATARTFRWPLLAGVFPRLCQTGFTYAQPLLINTFIKHIDSSNDTSPNVGYALIGAYILVFFGAAVSTGRYSHETQRAVTKVRGGLVTVVYSKTQKLQLSSVEGSSASTLMSTDIERVANILKVAHNLWATPLELVIAIVLLERQLGAACVMPVVLALACSFASLWLSTRMGRKQVAWLTATQKRLNSTSSMLGSIKGIKMTGMSNLASSIIAQLRLDEIRMSIEFQKLVTNSIVLSDVTNTLGPVVTFALFTIIAKIRNDQGLLTAQAFTSLTVLSLIGLPLIMFVQIVPMFMGAVASLVRIQEFLLSESREDTRVSQPGLGATLEANNSQNTSIELTVFHKEVVSKGEPIICLTNGAFGWKENDHNVLSGVDIKIIKGDLAMVVGSVGSGKSTLLKACLGETKTSHGQVRVRTQNVSFCDQTPWLMYGTIQENIVGMTEFDLQWYNTVLNACALQKDLEDMPDGDQTIIGSRGLALSGGQKQRISIARAVYARNNLAIFDDVLAGLDATTEEHLFLEVFGPQGLLRKLGTTTILVTNKVRRMQTADHIVAIGAGTILEQGSFQELRSRGGYLASIQKEDDTVAALPKEEITSHTIVEAQRISLLPNTASPNGSRQSGDLKIYNYYCRAAGLGNIIFTFGMSGCSAFCVVFSSYWLQKWVTANSNHPNDKVGFYLGIYAFLGITSLVTLWIFCRQFMLVAVPKSGRWLHDRVLGTTLGAPISFFTSTDSGVIMNMFSQDMRLIDANLSQAGVNTVEGLVTTIMRVILVCITAKYFATVLPFAFVAVYLIQRHYLRTSRQLRLLDIEAKAPLYSQFTETLDGLATIRAFGWEHTLQRRNHELLDASQKPFYLLACIQLWLTFTLDILTATLAILVVVLAVSIKNVTTGGDAGVAMVNVVSANQVLALVIISWTSLETSIGAVSRVRSFAQETPSELQSKVIQVSADWPQAGLICFQKVSASYRLDSPPVLKDITMSIQPGEKIGICGRTGSGKSSLILSLLQMLNLNSGTIEIDHIDLSSISKETLRSRITTVPQEAVFIEGTLRLNIDPSGKHSDEDIVAALEKVQLWNLICDRGGLDARSGDAHMSAGQRQLFMLARAMLKEGRILVLDEATSSMDVETNKLMQELIRSEFKDHTVIAVEHTLENILDYDRVAVFDTGNLVEFDAPAVLLGRKSAFRALYTS